MENTVESRKSWRKALKHRLRTRRKTSKEIPTIPITDLDSSEIPHHFNLTHCLPTEFELSPRETEMVSLPAHLSSILPDYGIATSHSPPNKALIRSRIDVIILTVLAKMKREFAAKPLSSIASASSIASTSHESVHLRVAREMKFVWKSGKQQVRLSGIVDYSLWYGKRNDHANMVMVKMVAMDLLKFGVHQCLAYMAIIHETKKQASIPGTSVYGVATDSSEWVFIRIRPNGEWVTKSYDWVHSPQEVVSMLAKTLAHAASFHPQTGQKRWCH
ncbi:hypothetical protein N7489_006670 [Penicillium chrysogenum]|uniref:PH domain-containing protein n=1 Tax=Penicillium chrysogenum TaxID=5076 RepID=A0ABQ8W467_PENCH|nr:uncharacterized protein N7489_006670 [Penicillium chrysogenum]KAJ5236579.1 hypothetical protein N7489_006670 [Penicillium chrysogenum]KAJ5255482.1 hypothetical protein N7505_010633 [Penicillium chrysogenum]KAJ5276541.1 hypothetical protein N7524_002694 [Penicillium chrysogenum]KAJ6152712.1 hypothetical protein N7497_007031 [Penicillium chrysogenum]